MDDIPLIKKQLLQYTASVFIPDELLTLILLFLSVKTITQFKCVSKSWNTLISDPTFVKLHLKKSSQIPHLITPLTNFEINVVSLRCLLKNLSIHVAVNPFHCPIISEPTQIVGSCNGLLVLLFSPPPFERRSAYWFYVWNPATRTISDKLGFFRDYRHRTFLFSFGCDYLTGTYKVVALLIIRKKEKAIESKLKVFNLGDNRWRNIQSFPFVPLTRDDGVHMSGTINWLAIHSYYEPIEVGRGFKTPNVEKCVIVSLDLSTETYTQFLLPKGFNEVPSVEPSLRVLMDCLCFLYDFKRTEYVIWQMKEFGVQDSWTLLFRIKYFDLEMHTRDTLLPLYLSKNGDTLIFTTQFDYNVRVSIYNWRDKRVERTKNFDKICRTSAIEYVESLVPTP